MRKFLITLLVVLLVILAYLTIFHGIAIGSFKLLSISQIKEASAELTEKAEEANYKVATELPEKEEEVSTSVDTLLENKQNYYSVANVSTTSQLAAASTEEIYNSEYLYLQIGTHAREEGVKLRLDIMSTDDEDSDVKDLAFTVIGKYVGIIDFISAIEDDSDLNFTIEDFEMQANEDNELEATFTVYGIRVQLDETTQEVDTSDSSSSSLIEILEGD